MSDVTLRQLEHFVAVAEARNITAGAELMHISQSAMSASLTGLEKALGTAVFQRYRRGVSLTPAGHALLRKARRLLDEAADLHNVAHELDTALRGPLIVGCYTTLAPSLMPPIITSFLEAHPHIDLRFIEGSDDELVAALHEGRCELLLTYDYRLEKFFPHRELQRDPLSAALPYALVPAAHPLADADTVDLVELAEEPFVLLDLAPAGEYFLQIFDGFGLKPQIRFRTKSHQLVFGLVARGLGCSLLTQVVTPSEATTLQDVVIKEICNELEPLPIVALSASGIRRTQRAEAFIEHIRENLVV